MVTDGINELYKNFEISSFFPSHFGIQFEIKKRNQGKLENEYGSQRIIFPLVIIPLDHKFKCRVESCRVESSDSSRDDAVAILIWRDR
mmetsp:Transcript_29633/g.33232  ORF Transcript_29633/g.33232 Transcript_29633/m.33232 type:complete len:88 (-) Transcript_29633:481-744(-)